MNKQEFISTLKTKLNILSANEVNDIINEYSDVIDQKIQDGKTEEEAVKDFGSINDLVAGILEAYKINPNRKSSYFYEDFASIIEVSIEKASEFFLNLFRNVNSDGLAKIVVYGLVVFVVLIVLRFPFLILESLLSALFFFGGLGSFNLFSFMINGFLSFAYIACCILIIASFIKSFKNKETPFQGSKPKNTEAKKKDNVVHNAKTMAESEIETEITNEVNSKNDYTNTFSADNEADQTYTYRHKSAQNTTQKNESSVLKVLSTILKIFVGFFLVPFYLVLVIACGLLSWGIVLLFQGAHIFGILLIILAFINFIGGFISLIQRAVYRPERGRILSRFIITMISSIICLGIGFAITFNYATSIQQIYIDQYNFKQYIPTQAKNHTVELEENRNYCFQDVNYVVNEDNTLEDELTFNVVAPNFTKIHFINDNLSYDVYPLKFVDFLVNMIKNNTWMLIEERPTELIELEIRIPSNYTNDYSIKNNCIRFN